MGKIYEQNKLEVGDARLVEVGPRVLARLENDRISRIAQ